MRVRHHLSHWLIPHKRNAHRPHLIRAHGLALVALLIVGVQTTAYAMRPAGTIPVQSGHVLDYATGSITPSELLILTNQDRSQNGLPPLTMNAKLNESAVLKANNMFAESYWAHVSRSCLQPWYFFTKVGYDYAYAGENLAQGFDTSAGVNTGWMNSPGHRANILNPHYTDVGFAVENGALPQTVTPDCSQTPQPTAPTTLVVAHYGSTYAATPIPTPTPQVASAAAVPNAVIRATPTLTPTPTPAPTPMPAAPRTTPPASTSHAVAMGKITQASPEPKQYSLFAPLSLTDTLPPAMLVTLALLALLLLVYLLTHFTVWRKGLSRWRTPRYKLYAAMQIGGLILVILYLATIGYGQVG